MTNYFKKPEAGLYVLQCLNYQEVSKALDINSPNAAINIMLIVISYVKNNGVWLLWRFRQRQVERGTP